MCIQNISLQNETSEVKHIRPLIFVTSFRWFRSQPWGFHLDFMMVASMFEWPQRKMWKMWMWHRTSKYKTWWTWMDDKWNCMVSHEFMVVNHDSNTCGFLFGGPCSWSCDLQPSKRRSSCCGAKSSSPPPTASTPYIQQIYWKFLKPEFLLKFLLTLKTIVAFHISSSAGRCWRGDARCQPVRTGALECEARTSLISSICFCQKMLLIIGHRVCWWHPESGKLTSWGW